MKDVHDYVRILITGIDNHIQYYMPSESEQLDDMQTNVARIHLEILLHTVIVGHMTSEYPCVRVTFHPPGLPRYSVFDIKVNGGDPLLVVNT